MEYRVLGRSGLKVSAVTFGAATFGATGELAKRGSVDLNTARRQIDICLEAGVNLLDTSNAYSRGKSEEILGEALLGKRDQVLVATKVRIAMGDGPNDEGLSRHHILTQCEASLKRLRTDHIDLYQLGEWDGLTPLDETLGAVDTLVRSGKVRYVGISNFTGWQLMKTMDVARDESGGSAHRTADPLLARDPRRRVRADPGEHRPGLGGAGLEPAVRWPPVGQIPEGRPPSERLACPADCRQGQAVRQDRGADPDR